MSRKDEVDEVGPAPVESKFDCHEKKLASLRCKIFTSGKELEAALIAIGLGDTRAELDQQGRVHFKMASHEHGAVIGDITASFLRWVGDRWGYASATGRVDVVRDGDHRSRYPDLSFWGPRKCYLRNGQMCCRVKKNFPDVVMQVSWKSDMDYETEAMDDLLNRVTAEGLMNLDRRPKLGYLISFKFGNGENSPPSGIDVYSAPQGMTLQDAIDGNGNASHQIYTAGQETDVTIQITPANLGINNPGPDWKDFVISMEDLMDCVENVAS